MREETVKIYKFDELEEDVQKTVIDKNRDWNVDGFDWYGYTYEYWAEKLSDIGFDNVEISFSGFCSQGDGASFTADVNIPKIVSSLSCDSYDRDRFTLETMLHKDLIDITITVERNSGHYSHENTCGIRLRWDCFNNQTRFEGWAEKATNQLEQDIETLRCRLCKQIYNDLESEYNYLTGNEAVADSLESNEIEFTSNGDIY